MDLIAQVVGAVFAFFAGIIGNILAHDVCTSANTNCTKIIKAAAARLAAFDRETTEQEWLADLQERETVTEKYRHAVGCFLAAPNMRRFAIRQPFAGEAPGIIWKKRPNKKWEARWLCGSPNALNEGWVIKSVKLMTVGNKADISTDEKEFLVETCISLQTELDDWVRNPASRNGA